jgi:hypothetical protein
MPEELFPDNPTRNSNLAEHEVFGNGEQIQVTIAREHVRSPLLQEFARLLKLAGYQIREDEIGGKES